ncbi:hypothetical protein F4678DRAFT_448010 [Xylaria arbuscula]|nr:hypothetical protein F4678DRAFT_448010 [Xylaria arbuscula]
MLTRVDKLHSARNDATSRMVRETKSRGGNAIFCLGFEYGDIGRFAQCCAYGTAATWVTEWGLRSYFAAGS